MRSKHARKHSDVVCSFCKREFKRNSQLFSHLLTEIREQPYFCTFCGKEFSFCINLQHHVTRTHNLQRHFNCVFCHRKYSFAQDFKRHILIHTEEKPYNCGLCDREFRLSNSRLLHIRTHTLERPYKCQECGLCVKTSGALSSHLKTHYRVKQMFGCELCGKHFIQQRYLEIHLRSHLQEKPFMCKLCLNESSTEMQLKTHMVLRHGPLKPPPQKIYSCVFCNYQTRSWRDLDSHLRTHTLGDRFSAVFAQKSLRKWAHVTATRRGFITAAYVHMPANCAQKRSQDGKLFHGI